ncbi:hypothetical protein WJX77_001965 [Trebouxia sp. C0004]
MWSWGMWIALVIACFFHKISAALMTLYLAYIFLYHGNRALSTHVYPTYFRSWSGWRKAAEYFPAKLHKSADLDPTGNYLFACHPHGITSWSAWLAFATEGTGFAKQFPGLTMHVLTLTTNLRMPFMREYLLLHGLSDVSRQTCTKILKSGKGQSIMLAIGGATESLYAGPGTMDLVLNRRKGFVRVALQTGASLVPVINFGENEVYSTIRGNRNPGLRYFQIWMEHKVGITIPIFWGQGVAIPFGFLPKRCPINTVVGAPIPVSRYDGDIRSSEGLQQVNNYHRKYIAALTELWQANKPKYAKQGTADLILVE